MCVHVDVMLFEEDCRKTRSQAQSFCCITHAHISISIQLSLPSHLSLFSHTFIQTFSLPSHSFTFHLSHFFHTSSLLSLSVTFHSPRPISLLLICLSSFIFLFPFHSHLLSFCFTTPLSFPVHLSPSHFSFLQFTFLSLLFSL